MNIEKNKNIEINENNSSNEYQETSSEVKDLNDKELDCNDNESNESSVESNQDSNNSNKDLKDDDELKDPYLNDNDEIENTDQNNSDLSQKENMNQELSDPYYDDVDNRKYDSPQENGKSNYELSDPYYDDVNDDDFDSTPEKESSVYELSDPYYDDEQELNDFFDEIDITNDLNENPDDDNSKSNIDQQEQENIEDDIEKNYSHFNDDPNKDIEDAFQHIDYNYDEGSVEWQEAANRYVDNLENQLDEISKEYDDIKNDYLNKEEELNKVVHENNLSPENCNSNPDYVAANKDYLEAQKAFDAIDSKKSNIEAKIEGIKPYIKERTSFEGFDQSNFDDAYNGMITNEQGNTVENAKGTCSINSIASSCNKQFGTSFTEKEMFDKFNGEGKCTNKEVTENMTPEEREKTISENGGTDYAQRAYMAKQLGLDYSATNGSKVSLEKMEDSMKKGYSVNLSLKSADLQQPGLSERSKILGVFLKSNDSKNYANHMVSVAGFSHNDQGKITGVWVNDTGGFTNSNRVFISKEKFDQMAQNTKGFSAERCIDANKLDKTDKNTSNVTKELKNLQSEGSKVKNPNNEGSKVKNINNEVKNIKNSNNEGTNIKNINNEVKDTKNPNSETAKIKNINNEVKNIKKINNDVKDFKNIKNDIKDNKNIEANKFNTLKSFKLKDQQFVPNSKVKYEGNDLRTDSYGKPTAFYNKDTKSWNLFANNKYEIDGIKYKTNEKGQIISCKGKLHLKEHEGRKAISDNIPNRLDTDHRGHLIADMFGGSSRIDNVVAMDGKLNQTEYKNMEMDLKKALEDKKDVNVKIKIKYDDTGRPSKFTCINNIDGQRSVKNFKNEAGGN